MQRNQVKVFNPTLKQFLSLNLKQKKYQNIYQDIKFQSHSVDRTKIGHNLKIKSFMHIHFSDRIKLILYPQFKTPRPTCILNHFINICVQCVKIRTTQQILRNSHFYHQNFLTKSHVQKSCKIYTYLKRNAFVILNHQLETEKNKNNE